MKPSAILFDLDGTLLDTAPEFTHCMNTLLQQEGLQPITLADLRKVVSFGVKEMIKFSFKLSEKDPYLEALTPRFLKLYSQNLGFQSELFSGVSNILQQLKLESIPWGIVTNKHQIYTTLLVEKFNLLKIAGCVISGDTLLVQKPDPAPLLYACEMLSVCAEDCWYIGDARTDVLASKNAKMRCAIANYGYIPQGDNPASWEADVYLNSPVDIERLLYYPDISTIMKGISS